jgi:CubicO group peptidase (beta-lactamase class C family)
VKLMKSKFLIKQISVVFLLTLMPLKSVSAEPGDEAILAEMKRQNIPGVAIGVVRDGKVVRVSGFGMANLEHNIPVTADTVFQTGSTGKQFAALAILMLEKDGKLSVEDPLSKFFPDTPKAWRDIKIKHLLSHTSGIEDDEKLFDLSRTLTPDALRKLHFKSPKPRKAGASWSYSNSGYQLIGLVIENVTGAPFHDFFVARIFKPLGMTATRSISEADIIPNRASGYERKDGKLENPIKNQAWVSPTYNATADGSTYITARDFAVYMAAMDDPNSPMRPLWDKAIKPVIKIGPKTNVSYGFGWLIDTVNGVPIEYHTGSWQGFRANIIHYPTLKTSIVVLFNSDLPDGSAINSVILKNALPGMPIPQQ